jgi:hypothetical protein
VDRGAMGSVFRPEFVARPEVSAPPIPAAAEVIVLAKRDAHLCPMFEMSGSAAVALNVSRSMP